MAPPRSTSGTSELIAKWTVTLRESREVGARKGGGKLCSPLWLTPPDNLHIEAAYVLPQRFSVVEPFRYATADAASARAWSKSQAVPVEVAHLECQCAHVFIQVIEFWRSHDRAKIRRGLQYVIERDNRQRNAILLGERYEPTFPSVVLRLAFSQAAVNATL